MPIQFDHEKLHVYQASIKFPERGPIVWMQKIEIDTNVTKYSKHEKYVVSFSPIF